MKHHSNICKRALSVAMCLLMILTAWVFVAPDTLPKASAAASVWDGNYSDSSEFQNNHIKSARALAWFVYDVNRNGNTYSGQTVYLDVDVDLDNRNFGDGVLSGSYNDSNRFKGTFDGQNKTISNFRMVSSDHRVAMFRTTENATFKNLNFERVFIDDASDSNQKNGFAVLSGYHGTGNLTFDNVHVNSGNIYGYNYVGALVGEIGANSSGNQLTMNNCSNGATINALNVRIGGLCGSSLPAVSATKCTNTGSVTGGSTDVGGIVGWIEDDPSSFTGCSNSGDVQGKDAVGGIVGYFGKDAQDQRMILTNNTNTGSVTATNGRAGGIAAHLETDNNAHQISGNTNRGEISATTDAGGIVARNKGFGTWTNNKNYGAVTASGDNAGGIVGEIEDDKQTFSNCTNAGAINGKNSTGGIVGWLNTANENEFTRCFNTGNITSDVSYPGGIAGRGSKQLTCTECFNVGTVVSGGNDAGGLVGSIDYHTFFYRCFNAGDVTAPSGKSAGGMIGYTSFNGNGSSSSNPQVVDCFNWGAISAGTVGGIAGYVNGGNTNYFVKTSYNAGALTGSTRYSGVGHGGAIDSGSYRWNEDNGGGSATSISGDLLEKNNNQNGSFISSNFCKNTWGVSINNGTIRKYPILTWYRDMFTFESKFVDSASGTNQTITKTYGESFTVPNPTRSGYSAGQWLSGNTHRLVRGQTVTAGDSYLTNTNYDKNVGPANTNTVVQSLTEPTEIKSTRTYGLTWNEGAAANMYAMAYANDDVNAATDRFRTGIDYTIYNLTTGHDSYFTTANGNTTADVSSGGQYFKTFQHAGTGNARATLVIDRSKMSDLKDTGVFIDYYPFIYTAPGGVRWGVEIFDPSAFNRSNVLNNDHWQADVAGTSGKSYHYEQRFSNVNGSDHRCAETNSDFTSEPTGQAQVECRYGSYKWYFKGDVPDAGDSVTLRIVAICAARYNSTNLQILSEWTDLTIIGTCTHSGLHLTKTDAVSSNCNTAGNSEYWYCDACGKYFSDAGTTEIAQNSWVLPLDDSVHDFTVQDHSSGNLKTAATCTDPAVYYCTCSRCGKNSQNYTGETFTYGAANGHHFTSGTYRYEGNGAHAQKCRDCAVYGWGTTAGATNACSGGSANCVHGKECEYCHEIYTDPDTANGHSYTMHNNAVKYRITAADCCHYAEYYLACENGCDILDTSVGTWTDTAAGYDSANHNFTGAVQSNGNGQSGTHKFLCANGCGTYGPDVPHTWSEEGVVTQEPGCATAGVKTFTCTVEGCGATYTASVSPTGNHHFTVPMFDDTNHWMKCADCDAIDGVTAHSFTGAPVWSNWTASGDGYTCTATFTCSGCAKTITPTVSVASATTGETCTANRFTTYTATVENNSTTYTNPSTYTAYVQNTATGHNYNTPAESDWVWTPDGEGGYTVTVTLTCAENDSTLTDVAATVSDPVIVDAGHTTNGSKTFTASVTVETGTGTQTFTAQKVDVIEAEGHRYGELIGAVAPSCEENGTIAYYECSVCHQKFDSEKNEVSSVVDPATGHTYGELIGAVAPSCEGDGTIAYYECSICHQKFNSEKVKVESIVDPATGHTYGELIAAVAPSCEGDGTIAYYECSVCHQKFNSEKVKVESIVDPATGHTYGTLIPEVPATCKDKGTAAHYHCTVCGKDFDTSYALLSDLEIDYAAHTYGTLIPEVPATCKDKGTAAHYHCSVCGKDFDESFAEISNLELDYAAHTYGELIPGTASSCIETGTIDHYECSVCHKLFNAAFEEVEDISASAAAHEYGELHAAKNATCTEDGNIAYYQCSVCHKFFDEEKTEIPEESIAIHSEGHNYGAWIAEDPADCTKTGTLGHYHCDACGKDFDADKNVIADLVIPVTDHNYGTWIAEEPASCTAPGVLGHYHCIVCGKDFDENKAVLADLEITQLAHNFSGALRDNGDGTHSAACSLGCGTYGEAVPHVFGDVEDAAFISEVGNCTTPPTYFKSCDCGALSEETFTGSTPGHNFEPKPGKPASCGMEGYTDYEECSVCHEIRGKEVIPALSHGNYVRDDARSGQVYDGSVSWEVYTCENGCGDSYMLFTVYARNDKGTPLSGARVHLTGNDIDAQGVTDETGKVTFDNHFADGEYEVTLTYSGELGTGSSYGKFRLNGGLGNGGIGTITTTGEEPTEPSTDPTPVNPDDGNGGHNTANTFRCSWCDLNDKWEGVPVIGWFIAFIHMFVHLGQSPGNGGFNR